MRARSAVLTLVFASTAVTAGLLTAAGREPDGRPPAPGGTWDVPVLTTLPTTASDGPDSTELEASLTDLADRILTGRDVGELVDNGQLLVRVGASGQVLTGVSGVFDPGTRLADGCGPTLGALVGQLTADLAAADTTAGLGDPARGLADWPVLHIPGAGGAWTVTFGPGGGLVIGIELDGVPSGLDAQAGCPR